MEAPGGGSGHCFLEQFSSSARFKNLRYSLDYWFILRARERTGNERMPLARYFFFVGGVLLALMFILDSYLPKFPIAERSSADLAIRIHSDQKWPERVVYDTRFPVIVPTQIANKDVSVPDPAKTAGKFSGKVQVREAFGQLQTSDAKQLQQSEAKLPEPPSHHRRKIAKRRAAPSTMLVARQPQFGVFGRSIW